MDASDVVEELRPQLVPPFERFRDLPFPERLVESATLSTFHGCPPTEVEAIVRHLMETYGLDVTVKLNPTLLGFEEVRRILRDLGYADVLLFEEDFAADLHLTDALDMFRRLHGYAKGMGRTFGIKLTNTLVVGNHRGVLAGERMYLSGEPLHVIAVNLLDRLVEGLPGTFRVGSSGEAPVSWSAGVDRTNVADTVSLGLAPVTVCTALLRPGGYGHLSTMLGNLSKEIHASGHTDIAGWVGLAEHEAVDAGYRDAVEAYAERLRRPEEVRGYTEAGVAKRLRHVDRALETWDCVSCNLCVTVCPNDAMMHLRTPESLVDELSERWQYVCLAELCNDCGNCVTFCPEEGEPFAVKPRIYLDAQRFSAADGQGYLLSAGKGELAVRPKAGFEGDGLLLEKLVNGQEGLPIRAEDLLPARSDPP